jgi:hypothetical protein
MKSKSMRGIFLLAVLMLVGVAGLAQAETKLAQLGRNPFYGTELRSIDEFRQMVAATLPELKTGFTKAGAPDLFDDFAAQTGRPEAIMAIEVKPGEKLQWMIFRKGKTVKVIKDVVWAGKAPFRAFALNVDKAGTRYTFVVPAICGNVSLAMTSPLPEVVQVPNVAPYCQVSVTPASLTAGQEVIIDASQSSDPDGSISSVLIQVTDGSNAVVKTRIDKPPFVQRMTMPDPGNYTIAVSVSDNKGLESSAPRCTETKITVTSSKEAAVSTAHGNLVADAGILYQDDPATYLLFRVGYDYYFNDAFSLLGMVGAAPVIDGEDDTDSFMVDLTANYHRDRMFYGAGVGFWNSSTDDRVDFIMNLGYRFYGEVNRFNIAVFVEARAAFDQFDELADYGRLGAGLRFQF